jgi:DNA-binding CsgD family transcriptional regulator
VLLDRAGEREGLDQVVEAVRASQSRALVIRGEAGVGKTALLEYLLERAQGCRVARVAGIQSEMELAFAVLHQLCGPMLDRLERLPEPQRAALTTAFGLQAGPTPDRFLVGLGALGLLAETAAEQPLVCVIDDAQWVDQASAQALAFAARRLQAESVAMVFAARPASGDGELGGLPELAVGGLDDSSGHALLRSILPALRDERIVDRIIAETGGNPLAILELPRGMTPAELASGLVLSSGHGLTSEIEDSFARRCALLPPDTQRLLLIAAAEPLGQPLPVWRAAEQFHIGLDAAEPAATAGLCEFGAAIRFRHPLVRSAAYRSATQEDRRAVHRALAEVTEPEVDPDRRAWHQAQAADGPDEELAAELEGAAGRAQGRGGFAQASAFLQQATRMTPHPSTRADRALRATRVACRAGEFDAASELLAIAQTGPLDELGRAHTDLLGAQIAFAEDRGGDAAAGLVVAAKQLEPLDVTVARETYMEAFSAAYFAARLGSGTGLREVAEAARAAPQPPRPRPADLLLDGLALLVTDGYAAAMSRLRHALEAFRTEVVSEGEAVPWLYLAITAAAALWDDESWDVLSELHLRIAREAGALSELPLALLNRTYLQLFAGQLTTAASLVEETATVIEAIGSRLTPYGALGLLAWQGREAPARDLVEASMAEAVTGGEDLELTIAGWAGALLDNGLGRYEDAVVAARQATELRDVSPAASNWAHVELIEAAVRSGHPDAASDALRRLELTTQASGTDWALGVEARSRALLREGEAAEALYREAIERLGRTRMRAELARAHLVYGEWLRRMRRRLDAREQLRTAHAMLTEMGIEAFAERAAREARATGATARKRTVESSVDLTPQEVQIARLASEGLSNPEIGSRLFLSPRTAEYHLRKVFTKLGITSRGRLAHALAALDQ